jgi:hypothetical protein
MTANLNSIDLSTFVSEHLERAEPDLLRSMLQAFVEALMGAEADAICGAPYGVRSSERVNSRNGYRPREWDTRAGTLELAIPKLRAGSVLQTRWEPPPPPRSRGWPGRLLTCTSGSEGCARSMAIARDRQGSPAAGKPLQPQTPRLTGRQQAAGRRAVGCRTEPRSFRGYRACATSPSPVGLHGWARQTPCGLAAWHAPIRGRTEIAMT